MAKKNSGMQILDVLPNIKNISVTWAAASTTYVYGEWDTGVQARDRQGVLIERIDWQPAVLGNSVLSITNAQGCRLQVHRGGTTGAQLDVDDARHISSIDVFSEMATAVGQRTAFFPISWSGVRLIVDPKITANMDATQNFAPLQSLEWICTIQYRWVQLSLESYIEAAEQTGVF